MERALTRRQFIKSGMLGIGSLMILGTGIKLHELESDLTTPEWLVNPNSYSFSISNPNLPPSLRGSFVNMPFLYRKDSSTRQKYISQMGPIKGGRIFINDAFEKTLGHYDHDILTELVMFSFELAARGKTLQVDLFDYFSMKSTYNVFYGFNQATSPYAQKGELAFFQNPALVRAFKNRLSNLAPALRMMPNLIAIAPGNEIYPAPEDTEFRAYSQWYEDIVHYLLDLGLNVPIVTGAANPAFLLNKIPGLTAKTVHLYPTLNNWQSLDWELHQTSLLGQEIGVPGGMFSFNLPDKINDSVLSRYCISVLNRTTEVNPVEKTVLLRVPHLSIWKHDAYYDSFNFHPDRFPQTMQVLEQFNEAIGRLKN